ncbi:hypothetical protein JTB14_037727 [Gonioctena quinquepunctata]|nr:hypothetical protein JTB14_037727 [Gonioctena quinquepunctata]
MVFRHLSDNELGEKLVCCDSCDIVLHPTEECTGLATSELRAAVLQKRKLMFLCKECRLAFTSTPLVIRQIEILRAEVKTLKQELDQVKERAEGTNHQNMESFMSEVRNRMSRSCNFMLYNSPENDSSELKTRIVADKKAVTDVMDLMGVEDASENIIKVLRVGIKNSMKPRPLKVICSDSNYVNSIIKSKNKLYSTEFRINRDQTKMQQEHWK